MGVLYHILFYVCLAVLFYAFICLPTLDQYYSHWPSL